MHEIHDVHDILADICAEPSNPRASPFGKFLATRQDQISFDTFDIYFNRNKIRDEIDIQVGQYTFNLREWYGSLHKLSEMLLLRGARFDDIKALHHEFRTFAKPELKKVRVTSAHKP